jgi:proline iminopeptidase
VKGLILRGIFLCRQQDIDWLIKEGANRFFPDAWEEFLKPIQDGNGKSLLETYYQKLSGSDELARMGAAKAWSGWEAHCATLRPNQTVMDQYAEPHNALSLARIEAHYFLNHGFIEENQILKNMEAIGHLQGIIVHGRYDMICPLDNAYQLHLCWPNSELNIVREAGHASSEPGIIDALVKATDEMAKILADSA